jgi:hypothetical protein
MFKMWDKILYELVPFLEIYKANNKINEKMNKFREDLDQEDFLSPDMEKFLNISIEEAQKLQEKVIAYRKSLEEKARVNVLIVTIAVTVILGLTSFLTGIQDKISNNFYLNIIMFSLIFLSLLYLIFGSIFSLMTLNAGELKEIYDFSLNDYEYLSKISDESEKERETKYIIARNTELNTFVNLKLNNYISCTYSFIRNAIILLGVVGTISCYVFILDKSEKTDRLVEAVNYQNKILERMEQNIISNNRNMNNQNINFQEILINELKKTNKNLNNLMKSYKENKETANNKNES